jgi:hypothetical protein
MRKHVRALIAALMTAVAVAVTLVMVLPAGAQVNPLCTTAAMTAYNAYWQTQVANATPATMGQVLNTAITATAARVKLCNER